MMIKIEKAGKWRHCNCCHSDKSVKEISFISKTNSIEIALCNKCCDELLKKLQEMKGGDA